MKTHLTRLALLVLLAAGTCDATVIFVTLTRDAIYVGADGRITITDTLGKETYGDTCKIHQFGKVFVADSGLARYDLTGFDVWQIFSSIKATSVSDFTDKMVAVLPAKYQAVYADRMKRNGGVKPDDGPGDIGVFAFEDGKPAFIWTYFYTDNGVIKSAIHNDGKEFARDFARTTMPIGEGNAAPVADFMACADEDEIVSTRCDLAAYIKADPKHINEPIAILKMSDGKNEWIEPGACAPPKPQATGLQSSPK